jgi:DNA-binding HxlR family transcriptional regulator
MTRTHKKVSCSPTGEPWTPITAAEGVVQALSRIEGRWKLRILFELFGGNVRRFSELERAIPEVTQKMLAQQLRQLEKDGLVARRVYPEVPPKVEYRLTDWGQSLCPALDALLQWGGGAPVPGSTDGSRARRES